MACADVPLVIQRVQEKMDTEDQAAPQTKYYKPQGPLPAAKRPLHARLQPAVLGSIQMVNGLFSVAMEIVLAITVSMTASLYVLLRISFLTGPLFFVAGLLANLMCKNPGLLPVCYFFNWAGVVMAMLEVVIISVDLSALDQHWKANYKYLMLMEICVMGMNLFLSLILCIWIGREKKRHKQFLNNK